MPIERYFCLLTGLCVDLIQLWKAPRVQCTKTKFVCVVHHVEAIQGNHHAYEQRRLPERPHEREQSTKQMARNVITKHYRNKNPKLVAVDDDVKKEQHHLLNRFGPSHFTNLVDNTTVTHTDQNHQLYEPVRKSCPS